MQRLGIALRQPRIIRTRNRTNRVLEEGQMLVEGSGIFGKNDSTHCDVGVAVDILREAMNDYIGILKQWRRVNGDMKV